MQAYKNLLSGIKRFYKPISIVTLFISSMQIFAKIYINYGFVAKYVTDNLVTILYILLLTVVISFVMILLIVVLENIACRPCDTFRISSQKLFFILLLILLLFWLPYAIWGFPGYSTYDSESIIEDIFVNQTPPNSNNPYLQIVLTTAFISFGRMVGSANFGFFLYTTFQCIFFAAVIAYAITVQYKLFPKPIITTVLLLFFALNPIIPMYALCIGKDSNFAISMLLFCVQIFLYITDENRFVSNRIGVTIFILNALLLCFLRNGAAVILLITLICLMFTRSRRRQSILIIGLPITIYLLFNVAITPSNESQLSENLSIPLQQTARYVFQYSSEITKEEEEIISKIIDYDELQEAYQPELSDEVKRLFNNNATGKDLADYFAVWAVHFSRHPKTYFDATFANSFRYFYFYGASTEKPLIFTRNIIKVDLFRGKHINAGQRIADYLLKIPIINIFLYLGVYTSALLWLIAYIFCMKLQKYYSVIIPPLAVLLGCIASPVNGYFRYAFPIVLSVPVLGALMISISLSKK